MLTQAGDIDLRCKAPIDLEKTTALFPKDSHCEAQLRCSVYSCWWLTYLWFPNVVENSWKCEIEGIFWRISTIWWNVCWYLVRLLLGMQERQTVRWPRPTSPTFTARVSEGKFSRFDLNWDGWFSLVNADARKMDHLDMKTVAVVGDVPLRKLRDRIVWRSWWHCS